MTSYRFGLKKLPELGQVKVGLKSIFGLKPVSGCVVDFSLSPQYSEVSYGEEVVIHVINANLCGNDIIWELDLPASITYDLLFKSNEMLRIIFYNFYAVDSVIIRAIVKNYIKIAEVIVLVCKECEEVNLVVWTDLVNVYYDNEAHDLYKTGGEDGVFDAGAISGDQPINVFSYGNGIEFRINGIYDESYIGNLSAIGLSHLNVNRDLASIDYAILVHETGHLSDYSDFIYTVYEQGVSKATIQDTGLTGQSIFKIRLNNLGQTEYLKDDTIFYTSTTRPTYPLVAKSLLWRLYQYSLLASIFIRRCGSGG